MKTAIQQKQCECADGGCPHVGSMQCPTMLTPQTSETLYRVDMVDVTGTDMCETCAADAYESGLFADEPNSYSA